MLRHCYDAHISYPCKILLRFLHNRKPPPIAMRTSWHAPSVIPCRFCKYEGTRYYVKEHEERCHKVSLRVNETGSTTDARFVWCPSCNLMVVAGEKHLESAFHIARAPLERPEKRARSTAVDDRAHERVPPPSSPPQPPQPHSPPQSPPPAPQTEPANQENLSDHAAESSPTSMLMNDEDDVGHPDAGSQGGAAPFSEARDFLPDRDDSKHFNTHPDCGSVFLVPLPVNTREEKAIHTRKHDRKNWRRWRVVTVDTLTTVYPHATV